MDVSSWISETNTSLPGKRKRTEKVQEISVQEVTLMDMTVQKVTPSQIYSMNLAVNCRVRPTVTLNFPNFTTKNGNGFYDRLILNH